MSWQFSETLWNEQGPIGQWDYTDDGAHVLALQDVQGGRRLYWDGAWGRPFDELVPRRDGKIFSPDFNHIALYGKRGADCHVVIDGVESPAYPDLTRSVPPTFSADGSRVLYGARLGDRYALIVDGVPLGSDHLAALPAVFSPDGRRIAYGAEDRHAVVPGRPADRRPGSGPVVRGCRPPARSRGPRRVVRPPGRCHVAGDRDPSVGWRPWSVEAAPPDRSPAHPKEPDRRYRRNTRRDPADGRGPRGPADHWYRRCRDSRHWRARKAVGAHE